MTTDSAESPGANKLPESTFLQGERVSFTGTLASMTHAQACELTEQHGGTATAHVSHQTTMLIVGEEGWPLEDDGQPSVKLRRVTEWRQEGLDIKIVNESEWLRILGLEERTKDVQRLYTPAALSQMLGVSVHLIRRWERIGLIKPIRKTYRLPYFDFQEVSSARRLCQLLESGVAQDKLESSLGQLRGLFVDADRSLAQLKILAHGQGVVYRDEVGLVEPATGQRLLDFDDAEPDDTGKDATQEEIGVLTLPAPADTEQLDWTFTEWYEQGCRLLEQDDAPGAIEAFRLCLMERATSPEVNLCLGDALYRSGNVHAALERYHVAVELDHEYIEAWTQLGCLHSEINQPESALEAFQLALTTSPDYADAIFHKAQTLHQLGRTAEATACWQRYLELDARGPWADTARQRLNEISE